MITHLCPACLAHATWLLFASLFVGGGLVAAAEPLAFRAVLWSTNTAPGSGVFDERADGQFLRFSSVSIAPDGTIAFVADVTFAPKPNFPPSRSSAWVLKPGEAPRLAVISGQPTGYGGTRFTNDIPTYPPWYGLIVDSGGAVAFKTRLLGGDATAAKDSAVAIISPDGAVSLPIREGEKAPDDALFTEQRDIAGPFFRNGVMTTGAWLVSNGGITLTLRGGMPSPPDPNQSISGAAPLGVNSSGQVLLYFDTFGGVTAPRGLGIFTGGSTAPVASSLDDIPTTSRKFYSFLLGQSHNSSGQVAFIGSDSNPTRYVLSGRAGALNVIIRGNDLLPGETQARLFSASDAQINDAGDVAFIGYSNFPYKEGIFFKAASGELRTVAIAGQPAVGEGLPADAVFTDIIDVDSSVSPDDFGLSGNGQVVFQATLQGTGLSGKSLWIWDPTATKALTLLLRTGAALQLAPGVARIVSDFSIRFGAGVSGRPTGYAESGLLALTVSFNDGTRAIVAAGSAAPRLGTEFHWAGTLGDDWHTVSGDTSNWKDENGNKRAQPPGSAGTERVVINNADVQIRSSPVSVGFITTSGGSLRHARKLTLNTDANIDSLQVEHDLEIKGNANLGGVNKWRTGTISVAAEKGMIFSALDLENLEPHFLEGPGLFNVAGNGTLRHGGGISLRLKEGKINNLGLYEITTGEVRETLDAPSTPSRIRNEGSIHKSGGGEFNIGVALQSMPASKLEVREGTLQISGGGTHNDQAQFITSAGSTLRFTGTHDFGAFPYMRGQGIAELFNMTYVGAPKFDMVDGSKLIFQGSQNIPSAISVDGNGAIWAGGSLSGTLIALGAIELQGDVEGSADNGVLKLEPSTAELKARLRVGKSAYIGSKLETSGKTELALSEFTSLHLNGGSLLDGRVVVTQEVSQSPQARSHLQFDGTETHAIKGAVEIGKDVRLTFNESATISLAAETARLTLIEGAPATLDRATIDGPGEVTNFREFFWKSGTIGGRNTRFLNRNNVYIEANAAGAPRLVGMFINDTIDAELEAGAEVTQSGDFFLDGGMVENTPFAKWKILAGSIGATPGNGQFNNHGGLWAPGGVAEGVSIAAPFSNDGAVVVGTSKRVTVEVTGPVAQLQNGALTGGDWYLQNGSTMTLPGPAIQSIGAGTHVTLWNRSTFGAMQLQSNLGWISLMGDGQFLGTPGDFSNGGALELHQGVFSVAGKMENRGEIGTTGAGGKLIANGTIENLPGGVIYMPSVIGIIEAPTLRNSGGTLHLYGSVTGNIENNSGIFEGSRLQLYGDFMQGPQGEFLVATFHETMTVFGSVQLAGSLTFSEGGGGRVRTSHVVLNADSIRGTFDNLVGGRVYFLEGSVAVTITSTSVIISDYVSAKVSMERWLDTPGYFSVSERGDPLVCGAAADPDGDGLNNGQEFMLGTNPRADSSSDSPRVTIEDGKIHFQWRQSTTAAGTFELQSAAEAEGQWTVETATPTLMQAAPDAQTFRIELPAAGEQRFLRVILRP